MADLVLLQCELEHRHQAPHLAMCLFARDLIDAGHRVRCALVHPGAIAEAAAWAEGSDLLILDSIFPFGLVRRLQDATGLPVLVGGHNALQHALRGPAEFAITGPGRKALSAFVEAWPDGDFGTVPGLWFERDGVLDCGPTPPIQRPADEVLPFDPVLDWDYFGPPRAPGSNLRVPSVVAEFGCVWNRSTAEEPFYADVLARVPERAMTARAEADLRARFVQKEGGCTFCTFRYTPLAGHRSERGTELLLEQARVLLAAGARGLSLQTEHPVPWIPRLLEALAGEGLVEQLDELHVRTIPWLVLKHAAALRDCIELCEELGVHLVVGQIGFEAFDERSLAIFHKGLSSEENRAAARMLTELTEQHEGFTGTAGHGLIPFHPWTRPEDLLENIAAVRADAPWLLPDLQPGRRLELYNEWTPLFWKAQDEGLLVESPETFGWGWTFADERTGEVVAVARALVNEAPERTASLGADVLEALARLRLSEEDPEARRAAYMRLRAQVASGRFGRQGAPVG